MDAPPRAEKCRLIYADPPWRFATYSDQGKGRSAEAHYDCLSLNAIKRFRVASWAAQRALLLLWATDPLLPRTLQVIEAWGFAHKTVGCYWVKPNASVGAVVARVVAARRARFLHPPRLLDPGQSRALPAGHALRAQAAGRRRAQAVDLTPAGHSRKPDETYARIERLLPRPYLELFARHSQPGWDGFGDQEDLFDRGPVLTRRRPSR